MSQQEITKLYTRINKELRKEFYNRSMPLDKPFESPSNLYSGEVLGPWPVYIIHSFPCAYFLRGSCSNCFFSLIPSIKAKKEELYGSLITQTRRVLSDFDELVLKKQTRSALAPRFPGPKYENQLAMFGFTTTGTFFGRNELPTDVMIELLSLISEVAKVRNLKICINIETRAEDVIERSIDGTLERIKPFLEEFSIMNSIGFESVNPVTRNQIYGKDLQIDAFEQAIKITKEMGMVPNAFAHVGWFSLNEVEILGDIKSTIDYLYNKNVSPIVTLPNISPYTIPHLLSRYGKMVLLDPRSVVEIIKYLVEGLSTKRERFYYGDPWYLGMDDQEPNPLTNIFDNPHKISCSRCTSIIKDAIKQIRRDYDYEKLLDRLREARKCSCEKKYLEYIHSLNVDASTIEERIFSDLSFAQEKLGEYIRLPELSDYVECRSN